MRIIKENKKNDVKKLKLQKIKITEENQIGDYILESGDIVYVPLKEYETKKGVKSFNVQYNIGKAKYVINSYDGKATHKDGSPFYGIEIFKNKQDFEKAQQQLKKDGYIEE